MTRHSQPSRRKHSQSSGCCFPPFVDGRLCIIQSGFIDVAETIEGRIIDLPEKGESARDIFHFDEVTVSVGGDLHFADGKATARDFIHKKRSSQHSPTSFMSAKYRSFCFKHPRLLSAAPDPTRSVVLGAHMNHIYELCF